MPEDRDRRTSLPRRAFLTLGLGALGTVLAGVGGMALFVRRVNVVERFPRDALRRMRAGASTPLFERYPGLADRIPWRPIGRFPTPVEEFVPPPDAPDVHLFVKRDDLSSSLYGGNKVRKLEYYLAEAELAERRTIITLGGTGSNHGLATAIHGRTLGFSVELALYDQPVTRFVRQNLGGFVRHQARLHDAGTIPSAFLAALGARRRSGPAGGDPYFIMVGGTSRLGCVGYVAAGLELARQVADGLMPEPRRIFVPLGTCGTAAGLIVGLKLAGLASRVVAVRVADPFPANAFVLRYWAQDVADFLHTADPAVPRLTVDEGDFDVVTGHLGIGYGVPTPMAEAATRWASPKLSLDSTYTGKTLAACLAYCRTAPAGEAILFWNTYNSAPVSPPDSWDGIPPRLRRIVGS